MKLKDIQVGKSYGKELYDGTYKKLTVEKIERGRITDIWDGTYHHKGKTTKVIFVRDHFNDRAYWLRPQDLTMPWSLAEEENERIANDKRARTKRYDELAVLLMRLRCLLDERGIGVGQYDVTIGNSARDATIRMSDKSVRQLIAVLKGQEVEL